MLVAMRLDGWPRQYAILADARPLTILAPQIAWRGGATFTLPYDHPKLRAAYILIPTDSGFELLLHRRPVLVLATAKRTGWGRRKRWRVTVDGETYDLRRAWFRSGRHLFAGSRKVGSVRRFNSRGGRQWPRRRRDALAELPGLDLPLQVFVMTLALTSWDRYTTYPIGLSQPNEYPL
jgi:hypothetical protein